MHSQVRDLKTSLPQPQNNFVEEYDSVLDKEQHFVWTSLTILIFGLWILIFGSGTKVVIFNFHFSQCDTSYSLYIVKPLSYYQLTKLFNIKN